MAQKQKLKSERGRLNEGIKDMFMTMDPDAFCFVANKLAKLRDTNKDGFNVLLEEFEEHKMDKIEHRLVVDVRTKILIQKNKKLNKLLCDILLIYWDHEDIFKGGYFWRLMPTKKENESEAQFDIRRKRMEDNLMQVMLDVLDDCDYYIKGTQNAQNPQK